MAFVKALCVISIGINPRYDLYDVSLAHGWQITD